MINEFDVKIMKDAIEISKSCPVTMKAYSVGAIIVNKNNEIITTGYSRETSDNVHAEEVAINKAASLGIDLTDTTIYSTMEPCGLRLSGKLCCADRIINAGIKRVIYSIKEPSFFVSDANGIEKLINHDIEVEQIEDLIPAIKEINKHIGEE